MPVDSGLPVLRRPGEGGWIPDSSTQLFPVSFPEFLWSSLFNLQTKTFALQYVDSNHFRENPFFLVLDFGFCRRREITIWLRPCRVAPSSLCCSNSARLPSKHQNQKFRKIQNSCNSVTVPSVPLKKTNVRKFDAPQHHDSQSLLQKASPKSPRARQKKFPIDDGTITFADCLTKL
jgi:hypothetical protein